MTGTPSPLEEPGNVQDEKWRGPGCGGRRRIAGARRLWRLIELEFEQLERQDPQALALRGRRRCDGRRLEPGHQGVRGVALRREGEVRAEELRAAPEDRADDPQLQ